MAHLIRDIEKAIQLKREKNAAELQREARGKYKEPRGEREFFHSKSQDTKL